MKTIFHYLEPISVEEARRKVIEFQNSYPTLAEYAKRDAEIATDIHTMFAKACFGKREKMRKKEPTKKQLLKLKHTTLVKRHIAAMEEIKQRDARIERLECDAASAESELVREQKSVANLGDQLNKILDLFPAIQVFRLTNPVPALKQWLLEQGDKKRDTEEKIKRLLVVLKLFATESSNPDAAEARLRFALGTDMCIGMGT